MTNKNAEPGYTPRIFLGDGLDGLFAVESGSIDMVLCDLPSGETAAEFDVKVDTKKFFNASKNALKKSGVCVVMASSLKFACELLTCGSDWYRYDLIWPKTRPTGFFNANKRPLRSHEFVLVFCRTAPPYNPQMIETGIPITRNTKIGQSYIDSFHDENYGIRRLGPSRAGATDRFPTSVIKGVHSIGANARNRIHPQQKPDSLFQMLIRTYTNEGDLVADPCAGSGTTGRAAYVEKRRYLCWDISPRFGCV